MTARNPGHQVSPAIGEFAIQQSMVMRAVLAEFISDVKAVGAAQVANEWPDLRVTYNKACRVMGVKS